MNGDFLSEPFVVPDVYASGLSHIEDLLDGNYRFTLFARQASFLGNAEAIVVARIVMPTGAIHLGVKDIIRVVGCCCDVKDRYLH